LTVANVLTRLRLLRMLLLLLLSRQRDGRHRSVRRDEGNGTAAAATAA
jgi:hypothetical protein